VGKRLESVASSDRSNPLVRPSMGGKGGGRLTGGSRPLAADFENRRGSGGKGGGSKGSRIEESEKSENSNQRRSERGQSPPGHQLNEGGKRRLGSSGDMWFEKWETIQDRGGGMKPRGENSGRNGTGGGFLDGGEGGICF